MKFVHIKFYTTSAPANFKSTSLRFIRENLIKSPVILSRLLSTITWGGHPVWLPD